MHADYGCVGDIVPLKVLANVLCPTQIKVTASNSMWAGNTSRENYVCHLVIFVINWQMVILLKVMIL